MAQLVYLLCALTSMGCAILLLKSYGRQRARLLLWSGMCFVCFGISNIVLFFDLIIFPNLDFSLLRQGFTLAGLAMLLYGLIWETK